MATASTRVPAPPATAPTTSPFKRPRAACPAAALRALSARPRPHLPPASKPTTERPVTPERRQLFPRRALHPAGGLAQGGSLPVSCGGSVGSPWASFFHSAIVSLPLFP